MPALLSCIGLKTYSILKNLTAPELPSSISLVDLTTILKSHFDQKPSVSTQIFHFYCRRQRHGESIASYPGPFTGAVHASTWNKSLVFSVITPAELFHFSEFVFVKRASGVSEAFSLVMKSNNCLRIRVLTRNACLYLAYVSPLGKRVLNRRMQLAPPTLGYAHKNHAPTITSLLKAWTVTVGWTDATMPCLSKAF